MYAKLVIATIALCGAAPAFAQTAPPAQTPPAQTPSAGAPSTAETTPPTEDKADPAQATTSEEQATPAPVPADAKKEDRKDEPRG